ncbi:hypothetical protein LX36DRAFT_448528 [Colletotrichum falcatum]|nr:hypothetical protein LX36DRAFT_448528 [Colletotrichum falcatum]
MRLTRNSRTSVLENLLRCGAFKAVQCAGLSGDFFLCERALTKRRIPRLMSPGILGLILPRSASIRQRQQVCRPHHRSPINQVIRFLANLALMGSPTSDHSRFSSETKVYRGHCNPARLSKQFMQRPCRDGIEERRVTASMFLQEERFTLAEDDDYESDLPCIYVIRPSFADVH